MTFRATFLIGLLAAVLAGLVGCSEPTDSDQAVLVQLKKAGSDLSKTHKIDFYLYLPSKPIAEKAALELKNEGFEVETRRAVKGETDWLCLASKTMIPKLADIKQIGGDLERLASSLGGKYDGWETEVVK